MPSSARQRLRCAAVHTFGILTWSAHADTRPNIRWDVLGRDDHDSHDNDDNNDGDDGDDDHNCRSSSTSSSHHSSPTSTSSSAVCSGHATSATSHLSSPSQDSFPPTHHKLKGNSIAGIVIGILVFLLLLLLALLCLRRRYRRRHGMDQRDVAVTSAALIREQPGFGPSHGVPTRTYANLPPSRAPPLSFTEAVFPAGAAYVRGGQPSHHEGLTRSVSISSLPNPYDRAEEQTALVSYRNVQDRDLPPIPDEPQSVGDIAHSRPTTESSFSPPPSSFYDPATVLMRGTTGRTTTSTTSTLHSEMASYQKQLEAHHEKEMQARDDLPGGSGGALLEPPPEYQAQLPSGSTSDLGDVGHEHGR